MNDTDTKSQTLSEAQHKVLKTLTETPSWMPVEDIILGSGEDQPMVMATLAYGEERGWVDLEETAREEIVLAEGAAASVEEGLPERRGLELLAGDGGMAIKDLASASREKGIPMNEIIKWGTLRGWFRKEGGRLVLTEKGQAAVGSRDPDEEAVLAAREQGSIFLDDLESMGLDGDAVRELLLRRPALAKIKKRIRRRAVLTEEGRSAVAGARVVKEKNILSSEDISSGEWRNIRLRHYDVTLETEKTYPAKIHILQKIIQQTRQAFLEMGFTEIVSPQVESAFWDFDALFQPQDHPARDMQDTFYLERPSTAELPDEKLVQRVKSTHEQGWETGSTGWGYTWKRDKARQLVLRTHTTASTIRALAENPNPPRKVFCVGKVFRNEAISYKHLPEFLQVDGVIIDEDASLVTLMGTLKEFYRKMGFAKVRFKPAFYPYTEPSVDVIAFMESRGKWIEMGGSGVFRPEVTVPFGCRLPVLAWGLGVERLALLRYGLKDIRELFWSDFDKIREVPLCL
jgi:phenylalanyl-tRNA synthetase alpha chain